MQAGLGQRRRALALVWGAVFVTMVGLTASQSAPQREDLPAAIVLTLLIAALTSWPNLRGSRVEYDPSTPVVVVSALSVSPGSAPLLLLGQAIVVTLIDWATHKRSPSHAISNAGVFALWHGALAVMVANSQLVEFPGVRNFAVGLCVIAALAVMLNNLTVAISTAYLYGNRLGKLDLGLADQLRDVAISVALGVVVFIVPGPDWTAVLVSVAILVYGLWYLGRYRGHRTALMLEAQARIVRRESSGPLPGHTQRVADAVRTLGALHGCDRALADAVAWTHSSVVSQGHHRCSGTDHSEFVDAALRSLPRMMAVRRLQPVDGLPAADAPALTHIVAAACAWDSRVLPGSPVNSPADLHFTFGIRADIVDRVVDLDPGWVTDRVRRHAGRSTAR